VWVYSASDVSFIDGFTRALSNIKKESI